MSDWKLEQEVDDFFSHQRFWLQGHNPNMNSTEEMRAKMKALSIPGLEPAGSSSVGASSGTSAWPSSRPSRPRPSLNVGSGSFEPSLQLGGGGSSATTGGRRPTPKALIFPSTGPGGFTSRNDSASALEQEKKFQEIIRKSGQLKIHGQVYNTRIDDLELLGDLGNGHFVMGRSLKTDKSRKQMI